MADLEDLNATARSLDRQSQDASALDVCRRLVEEAEAPQAALLARAGDLELRLGNPEVGAMHLARAAGIYAESGLLNLALALCHRLLRLDPPPVDEYLRLGELSAAKGYARDARLGYVEYAERRERGGDIEAARSALAAYLRDFPDDSAIQRRLADLNGTPPTPETPVREAARDVKSPAAPEQDLGVLPTRVDAAPPVATGSIGVAPLEGLESNRADEGWGDDDSHAAPSDDSLPLLGVESGSGYEPEPEPPYEAESPVDDADEEVDREPAEAAALPLLGSAPEYVDLGALILSEEIDLPTRVRVQAEQPSGDDAKDLEEILGLFREKVAQKIDPKDAASHYDLGLAFKEMGLFSDAIAQLQAALRAGAPPLATLEVLGECFIDSGDSELAARLLDRATRLQSAHEDDLVGVRRLLERARVAAGFDKPSAST